MNWFKDRDRNERMEMPKAAVVPMPQAEQKAEGEGVPPQFRPPRYRMPMPEQEQEEREALARGLAGYDAVRNELELTRQQLDDALAKLAVATAETVRLRNAMEEERQRAQLAVAEARNDAASYQNVRDEALREVMQTRAGVDFIRTAIERLMNGEAFPAIPPPQRRRRAAANSEQANEAMLSPSPSPVAEVASEPVAAPSGK
jgi:chromosome segregation ATPase